MKKIEPINVGDIFGRLFVVEEILARSKFRSKQYLCKCECGNEIVASRQSLKTSNTRSCGCLHSESAAKQGINRRKDKGWVSFNTIKNRYYHSALDRNIDYNLSFEDMKKIITQNCFYCNTEPTPYNTYIKRDGLRQKRYAYISDDWVKDQWVNVNGIDRVDNTIGYELSNCVPCCPNCNHAKMELSTKNFLDHIIKIYNHQKKLGNIK